MRKSDKTLTERFILWRLKYISNKNFIIILSIIVGISSGIAAVIIKKLVELIHHLAHKGISIDGFEWLYLVSPGIGILFAVLFIKYIVRRPVRHGIPNVLYSISKNKGHMNKHNMISSVIASSFTVGFGGSVGLEGPTVSTGAAIGANLGKVLNLNYRQITLLLGCASAGAMSAIFKAPIAAIVFVLEVIMLDLSLSSLVPILLSSTSAVVTSYIFLGQKVLYPVHIEITYTLHDLIFYVALGLVCGLVATYFTRIYKYVEKIFENINNTWNRLLIGAASLGVLMFLFPHLFGEGYEVINGALQGNLNYLHDVGIFKHMNNTFANFIIIMVLTIGIKVIATSITFGSGGVGGIFAPTLFMGANTGILFATIINKIGDFKLPLENFALIAMSGLIAGVLHAPLTGLFLIADLSGGYSMFLPLMITATISFLTAKSFEKHSVYTHQLAMRKELLTHDTDKNVMTIMDITTLIETDFAVISPKATLGDLVKVISKAHRNLFPVVDDEGILKGMIKLDDIREIMFIPEKYNKIKVDDLMYMPEFFISPEDSMEDLVSIFKTSVNI